jgi:hypothetical protein
MNASEEQIGWRWRSPVIPASIIVFGLGLTAWGIYAYLDNARISEQIETVLQSWGKTDEKVFGEKLGKLFATPHWPHDWVTPFFGGLLISIWGIVFLFPRRFLEKTISFRKRPPTGDSGTS